MKSTTIYHCLLGGSILNNFHAILKPKHTNVTSAKKYMGSYKRGVRTEGCQYYNEQILSISQKLQLNVIPFLTSLDNKMANYVIVLKVFRFKSALNNFLSHLNKR